MPNNQEVLTLLEESLKKHSSSRRRDNFPGSRDYFNRFNTIKDYLYNEVFDQINPALAASEGCVFTDHGPKHFDAVMTFAGRLASNDDKTVNLRPYEIYLLLVAILLHDAANIFGRTDHEKNIAKIVNGLGTAVMSDRFETKIIREIAEVHSGKVIVNGNTSKDTIGLKGWKDIDEFQGIAFRPKTIAGILRFADEICESCERAARFLLSNSLIAPECAVFHKYAECIQSVSVDHGDKSIRIIYYLLDTDTKNEFQKLDDNVYLSDEILNRLEKMNCERIYCSRFIYEIVQLHKIKAEINIVNNEYNILETHSIQIEDSGYPTESGLLIEKYPELKGDVLKNKTFD